MDEVDIEAGPITVFQVFHRDGEDAIARPKARTKRHLATLKGSLFDKAGVKASIAGGVSEDNEVVADEVLVRVGIPGKRLSIITDGTSYILIDPLEINPWNFAGCKDAFTTGERKELADLLA